MTPFPPHDPDYPDVDGEGNERETTEGPAKLDVADDRSGGM